MDNNTLQAIREVLTKNQEIGIITGKNPNLDIMGASLALYLSLKQANKNVVIACPTEPIVEVSSLVGIDKVKTNLGGEDGDLIVSFPYREGEIEKVSYTLEEGYLNIVVKAGANGLSFNENEVKYKREGNLPNALFIVGTSRISDLGNLFDPEKLKNTTIVNIDNKSDNQGFGDIILVSPKFSSVSEQMANSLLNLGFELDVDIAQNLLSGITFATNNFQDARTSSFAFEMAGQLLKRGALRQKASQRGSESQEFNQFLSMGVNQTGQKPFDLQNRQNKSFRTPSPFPRQAPKLTNEPSVQGQRDKNLTPADWLTPKVYKGSTEL